MRHIISFLLIFTVLVANGHQISPGEAQSIATEFLNPGSASKIKKAPRRAVQASRSAENQSEPQPYYIFNADDNDGFVIISGDTRAKKILGYSDTGSFDLDNMPPQLNALLEQYAQQIASLPESTPQDASWSAPQTRSEEGGILLETANWGQGYPYNAQCPIIDGVQAPTGCTATAMAIIMNFHNWPKSTRGFHVNVNTGQRTEYSNVGIDWSDMKPTTPEMLENEQSIEQVSKLMRSIGEAINSDYGLFSTSAVGDFTYPAFFNCFKYKHPRYRTRACSLASEWEGFSDEEWSTLINNELLNNRPVLYFSRIGGDEDELSGHAYVVDGVDENGLYHVNWGWEGSSNGYYTLWIAGSTPSIYHAMVTQIEPDINATNEIPVAYIAPSQFEDIGWNVDYETIYHREAYSNDGITCDEWLQGAISGLVNPFDFDYQYAIAFVDNDRNVISLACDDSNILQRNVDVDGAGFYRPWSTCFYIKAKHPSNAVGTCPVYRMNSTDAWHIVPSYSESISFSPFDGSTTRYVELKWSIPDNFQIETYLTQMGIYETILPKKVLINSINVMYGHSDYGKLSLYYNGKLIHEYETGEDATCRFPYEYYRQMSNKSLEIEIKLDDNGEKKIKYGDLWYIINENTMSARTSYENFSVYFSQDNYKSLKTIEIEPTVLYEGHIYYTNEIGKYSFSSISGLDSIIIPHYITSIKEHAFEASPFFNLYFEKCSQLKSIGERSFSHYNGDALELPEGIEEVGDGNFYGACLDAIKLPKSLKKIGCSFNVYNPRREIYIIVPWETPLSDNVSPEAFIPLSDSEESKSIIVVPKGTKVLYEGVEPWENFEIREYIEPTLTLNKTSLSLRKNEHEVLTADFKPAYSSLKWKSSNNKVALAMPDGTIVAVSPGSATITVYAAFDSNINATCTVNVCQLVESITLNETEATLNEGQTVQLTATISPEVTDNKTLEWVSSDEAVATVDQTGLVTAIADGTATITAKATDGSDVSAACLITVTNYTGIDDVPIDADEDVKIYNASGTLLFEGKCAETKLDKGIYIIVTRDGKYKRLVR